MAFSQGDYWGGNDPEVQDETTIERLWSHHIEQDA
jgi:hypothetical protein